MRETITIYAIMGFVWLSYGALHHTSHGYSYHDVEAVSRLSETPTLNPLLPQLIKVESGGNPFAISNKGARGIAQIMPSTAKHPGFGIQPLRNNSIAEQIRFANDYLNAMERRYGDKRRALAAYNCGPSCADMGKLPKETKEYVRKVLGR